MEAQTNLPVVRPAYSSMLREELGRRRTFLIAAALTIAVAGALNWSWLVAIGIAPLILSVLPCVSCAALASA